LRNEFERAIISREGGQNPSNKVVRTKKMCGTTHAVKEKTETRKENKYVKDHHKKGNCE
jgi:hypothetical protein